MKAVPGTPCERWNSSGLRAFRDSVRPIARFSYNPPWGIAREGSYRRAHVCGYLASPAAYRGCSRTVALRRDGWRRREVLNMIIFGTQGRQQPRGIVAEHCPECEQIQRFVVVAHYEVGHVYFMPIGEGTHKQTTIQCPS